MSVRRIPLLLFFLFGLEEGEEVETSPVTLLLPDYPQFETIVEAHFKKGGGMAFISSHHLRFIV